MSEYFTPLIVGNNITELPKSMLPASAVDGAGHYPFFCSSSEVKATTTWLQEKPTVLMGTGGVASVNYGEDRFAYSTDTWGFRSNNAKLETSFLFRRIQQHLQRIDYAGFEGSGLRHLRKDYVKKLKINVPSPDIQMRIVAILDSCDLAIKKTEALIAKYQQIKAGMMHGLFTRGVTADGKLRPPREQAPDLYQETPIGWIPKGWDVPRIGDIFDIQLGKMLNKLAKTGKGMAPYLGNRAVQWDFIDSSAIEEMDFSPSEREKFSLMPGDLLVCEGGDVGRTAMWRGELDGCYFQKAIHRLRPKSDRAFPAFMLRFMRFAKENGYFREFTSQSSIAHLTQEKLSAISMFLPKPDEQNWISERFNAIDKMIQNEQSNLYKLHQQKQGLMHDLLTGRVRVQV